MTLIYITCKNLNEAKNISQTLINQKLIVCSNMFPIDSIYRFKGKVHKEKEVAVLIKSLAKNISKIQKAIKKIHSYEVPEILSIKIDQANREYSEWIGKELK